jgi:hypothetical protein
MLEEENETNNKKPEKVIVVGESLDINVEQPNLKPPQESALHSTFTRLLRHLDNMQRFEMQYMYSSAAANVSQCKDKPPPCE